MNHKVVIALSELFHRRPDLRQAMEQALAEAALLCPDKAMNPVRSLSALYDFLDSFLLSMPWEPLYSSAVHEASLFRRIDQSTGYFYFLFQDLQYEPDIASWIKAFNRAWAEFLSSPESWNDEYYRLLLSDPLFCLQTDKYESPDNWHCFNDFFARRLGEKALRSFDAVAEGVAFPWQTITGNTLRLKTATIDNITALLGDSPCRHFFSEGSFMHISLDFYNYHHFHSPVDGTILDVRHIDGALTEGGRIVWDSEQHRYRYEQLDNIGFQMLETRAVIVIEPAHGSPVAVVPVGVAQVGSVFIEECVRVGAHVCRGQDLGHFLCGGSDVVVLSGQNPV